MLRLILLVLLSIVYAREDTGFGQFQIFGIGDNSMSSRLKVSKGGCIAAKRGAVFNYFTEGLVTLFGTGEYLAIDEHGYLVTGEEYRPGFLVSDERGPGDQRFLTYYEEKMFKVCPNQRIGFDVNCENGKRVFILYSDFNEYR
ncbi:hypothetical protein OXX79_010334 [Metschnikowia pulcherrima]